MPIQDRTGNKYEQYVAHILESLGYVRGSDEGGNFFLPPKNGQVVIPGTYIQPDVVIRENITIKAIIYVTHWSNIRNCKFKFWGTWEEYCQQKIVSDNSFLGINCVFEALPETMKPMLCRNADDLPTVLISGKYFPIPLLGWYMGVSSALIESFDNNIIFPIGYSFQHQNDYLTSEDSVVSIMRNSLNRGSKSYLESQWRILKKIKAQFSEDKCVTYDTHTRYRVGLLHFYIVTKLFQRKQNSGMNLSSLLQCFIELKDMNNEIDLKDLCNHLFFKNWSQSDIVSVFEILAKIPVRSGEKGGNLCEIRRFSIGCNDELLYKAKFNKDFGLCLSNLAEHISKPQFENAIWSSFRKFDQTEGIEEWLDDLFDIELIDSKAMFVEKTFKYTLSEEDLQTLQYLFSEHLAQVSTERGKISSHSQNWVFEMLVYFTNLNTTEDLQKNFKAMFERSGHKLGPHSPYGDFAITLAYLLRGKDICEQWNSDSTRRTLSTTQFYQLCWETLAECIFRSFREKGKKLSNIEDVIQKYVLNKSMKIIASSLNGFEVMVDFFVGDLCIFSNQQISKSSEFKRILPAWQTEVSKELWNNRPLETWFDAVAMNNQWLIKIQSAPSNPGDKCKELAGRARGMHIAWSHGEDPFNREQWSFSKREMPKIALVLDGDWSATQKRNLYEAGWDWVGDVSQLDELRTLITSDDE